VLDGAGSMIPGRRTAALRRRMQVVFRIRSPASTAHAVHGI
jgi:hypothetical protein